MNQIDYCDVAQSLWIEEEENDQSRIGEDATGSMSINMDMDGNTNMNKITVEEFDSQEFNPPSFGLPYFDSIENGSEDIMFQGFNSNDSFFSESKLLKQDDQSSYLFEMQKQDDQSSNPFEMQKQDDQSSYPFEMQKQGYQSSYPLETESLTLDQSSDGMNDSICPSTSIGKVSLPVCGYGGEDSVDDSANDIYTEGQEDLVAKDDDEQENNDNGRMIRQWTEKEMDLLEEGVKLYGTKNNWKKIAAYIGGRSASQCVNKWKNRRSEKWTRWNKETTEVLKELINQGLSFNEIQKRMSGFTYIQIYQHHQKFTMNNGPWEDWEVELLIKLKKEGKLSDTKIGKKLNNRHKDNVKCKWNEIKKKHQFY